MHFLPSFPFTSPLPTISLLRTVRTRTNIPLNKHYLNYNVHKKLTKVLNMCFQILPSTVTSGLTLTSGTNVLRVVTWLMTLTSCRIILYSEAYF